MFTTITTIKPEDTSLSLLSPLGLSPSLFSNPSILIPGMMHFPPTSPFTQSLSSDDDPIREAVVPHTIFGPPVHHLPKGPSLYGCQSSRISSTLQRWIHQDYLRFDVIMLGALTQSQAIYPLLALLPLHRLCAQGGSVFIWASVLKIQELTRILNGPTWMSHFRHTEELVFISETVGGDAEQWHCWMCVARLRCGALPGPVGQVGGGLSAMEASATERGNAVPALIYKVAENLGGGSRRLHIIPSSTGEQVNLRPGWVVLAPQVEDNFDPIEYSQG